MKYQTMDLAGLSERLIAARKQANITQDQAAKHLHMSRPTFIAMEKGSRRPKPEELIKLAELYKVTLNSLLRNEAKPQPLTPHLRSSLEHAAGDQPEVKGALDLLAAYIDDYCFLESLVMARRLQSFPNPVRLAPGSIEKFAEHCAQEERSRLDLGLHQPINTLRKVLEEAGVHVFLESLDSKLAGLYAFVPHFGYCILINRKHPKERRHWTIAHEYGHFLLDRDKPGIDYVKPSRRKSESERFADAFAAAFLMPESGVQRRFYEEVDRTGDFKVGDLCRMADYFSVSPVAMALRLESLGLIPRGSWDLISDSRVRVRDIKEEAGVYEAPDQDSVEAYPKRYKLLAVQAFQEQKITEGQLAKLLRCSRVQAREIVDQCSRDAGDDTSSRISVPLSHSLLSRG